MIVDVNLLLYARNQRAPQHEAAREWLEAVLGGPQRIGLPWHSLGGFLRIATNARGQARPLSPEDAWEQVEDWLAAPVAYVPHPGPEYATIVARMTKRHQPTGKLVPDMLLAALAFEHGVAVASADGDFARFDEVRWVNPLDPKRS